MSKTLRSATITVAALCCATAAFASAGGQYEREARQSDDAPPVQRTTAEGTRIKRRACRPAHRAGSRVRNEMITSQVFLWRNGNQ